MNFWPTSTNYSVTRARNGPPAFGLAYCASSWIRYLLLLFLASQVPASAQTTDARTWSLPAGSDPSYSLNLPQDRPVSWKLLAPNVIHDQKTIWSFPAGVVRGRHWKPAVAFVVATAALAAVDPYDAPYFRRTGNFVTFNKYFSGRNTGVGMAMFPLSFYAAGLLRKDSHAQHTSLLAAEAVADAEILTTLLKHLDHRLRPVNVRRNGNYSDTWFDGGGGVFRGSGSFPSGHTIAAFSIATVFADRYRRHRWVPWVAYGLATAVGLSRITLQSHFPSDVFAGAAFGYFISHYAVLGGH